MNRTPYARIVYNGTDITSDISKYLLNLSVTDKVAGESDEVTIVLEDTDGLWRGDWYPNKRDKLTVELGYEDEVLSFGTFEVDEVEFAGSPDTVTIKGIAAGISKQLRTKRSSAHEGKTLKQIADTIAAANGLTVQGEIEDIQIGRVTQDRETDLGFLKRIAGTYGYIFSVRDTMLIFTDVFTIQKAGPITEIDRTQVKSFNFKDSTADTAKSAKVSYHNPETGEEVDYEIEDGSDEDFSYSTAPIEQEIDSGGVELSNFSQPQSSYASTKEDVLEIRARVENKQQAERVGKAALHSANSRQVTCSINTEGNPNYMAGVNVDLTGFRRCSGKFHFEQVTHSIDKSGGYSCDISGKKVGKLSDPNKEFPLNERTPNNPTIN